MHEVARRLPEVTGREEGEEALDKLEYLFEVIPPELQDIAETLIGMLPDKLKQAGPV